MEKVLYLKFKFILIFLGVLSVMMLGSIGANIILIISFLYCFQGVDAGIHALTFSYLIYLVNPVLFNSPSGDSLVTFLRFLLVFQVFGVAVFHYFKQRKKKINKLSLIFFFYSILTLWLTIKFSQEKSISILKQFSFFAGVMGIFLSYKFSQKRIDYWLSWYLSLFVVIITLSLFSFPFNSIAFVRQGLFQGITTHPQAFSVYLSSFIAFLLIGVFQKIRYKWVYIIILGIAFLEMFLSKGRTGLLAILLGIFVGSLIFFFSKENSLRAFVSFSKKPRVLVSMFVLLIVMLLNTNTIVGFVMKRGETDVTAAFETSRMAQVLRLIDNIDKNPWTGIGFGLPSNIRSIKDKIKRDPILGLPVSVPTEKGFLPLGVVEEVGIIGSIFFYIFLLALFRKIGNMDFPVIVLITSSIFANLGEMFFFSFGGIGLYMWLLTGLIFVKKC